MHLLIMTTAEHCRLEATDDWKHGKCVRSTGKRGREKRKIESETSENRTSCSINLDLYVENNTQQSRL